MATLKHISSKNADYGKLKKQAQEYDVIKRNIDNILQTEKQPERERQTERGYCHKTIAF